MVWAHCQSKEILDDARCPVCGMSKAEWTVHLDATRVFKVSVGKSKARATTWLEVLVLDRDGNPLRGSSSLRVDLPDGRWVTQQLQDGLCRLEGIAPGACRVTFAFLRPRGLRATDADDPAPPGAVRMVEDFTFAGERGVTCATGTRLTLQLCHYIEIIGKDHEGLALRHEPFALEFKDGTRRLEGRLDELGRALVVGLLRGGPCEVVFPKRGADAFQPARTL